MKSSSQIIIAAAGLATCLALLVGCTKSTVEAVPRNSNAKPVFGNKLLAEEEKKSGDINFDFVHADHFACLSLNIKQIVSHDEFKDISWESVEKQMAEVVGPKNAKLESIERVWLMLDRQSVSMMMEGTYDGLFVTVIQYKTSPDLDQLAIANSARAASADKEDDQGEETEPVAVSEGETSSSESPPQFENLSALAIGGNRIAIGSKQLIGKMKRPQQPNQLSRQLSRLEFSADVEGIVAAGPVRETLKSVFGIAAQFGGKEAKKFASLPDVLEQIEIKICLDGGESNELMSVKALIDDPGMIEEVVRATRKAISQPSSENGGTGKTGIGEMFGGGFQGSQKDQQAIFDLKTTPVAEQVFQEIQEKELFAVDSDNGSVTFRLGRPEQTSELISAMVADSQRAMEFEQRVSKMRRIAAAMESYHEKYDCFPPKGVVRPKESVEENSIPPQLNWRVGLLPFLGEQSLYEQFDFQQQWDSELNLKTAKSIPDVFSVADADGEPVTRFHLPGGKLGLFSDTKPKSLADISDRKSSTAIVVESDQEHEIVWTKPTEFPIDGESLSKPELPFGLADENGVLIISAGFKPRMVKKSPIPLTRVVTPQGGEKLLRADFFSMPRNQR